MFIRLCNLFLALLLATGPAFADAITLPYSYSPGQVITAAKLNANNTAITAIVNGSLSDSNIKVGAGIAPTKIDFTQGCAILRAAAANGLTVGTTGDTVPRLAIDSEGDIHFGPGGVSARDIQIMRKAGPLIAIRNEADSADADLTAKAITATGAIVGTTGTFSGAAQATALTLTTTPLPYTSGGTGLATAATGTVLVGNGTGYTAVGPGTNGQVLKSNGTTLAMGAVGGSFGGDGSAGAVTKGAVTETTRLQLNATDFTQTVSTTWAPLSGTMVNATITCAFNGTTTVATGCSGGAAARFMYMSGSHGSGLSGGSVSAQNAGGGGGGNAGAGGDGGCSTASYALSWGGVSNPISSTGGSGGGGGGAYSSNTAGAGGPGGGCLIACSVGAMTVGASGTINAKGTAGTAGTTDASGGGGGSGGTVSLNSQTSIANSGTINVSGGNGGAGSGASAAGGGGGGGGYVQFVSPSNTNGTRTVSGGSAGATGGQAATAGSSGLAVSITATPNLPLLLSMQSDNFARMKSIALAHKVLSFPAKEGFDVELTQREAATACSRGSVVQFAKLVDGSMTDSTCLEIGDAVEVLDNAA